MSSERGAAKTELAANRKIISNNFFIFPSQLMAKVYALIIAKGQSLLNDKENLPQQYLFSDV